MANMLYNGVELLDINPFWTDKTTYPYAAIQVGTGYAGLVLSTEPFYFDGTKTRTDGNSIGYVCPTSHDIAEQLGFPINEWTQIGSDDSTDFGSLGATWSNHDIINTTNGSVYLAASTPTNPSLAYIDITRFEVFILGQQLRPALMGLGIGGKSYEFDQARATLIIHQVDSSLSYSYNKDNLSATIREV